MNTMKMLRAGLLCAAAMTLVACGADQTVDGAPAVDVGQVADDAGVTPADVLVADTTSADATADGVTPDGGSAVPDEITFDAGSPDLNTPDTGAADVDDSGAVDGGGADVGTVDASAGDAIGPDAGGSEATLCNPCGASTACATTADPTAACVNLGASGAFCGASCTADSDCESDYICSEVTTVEGVKSKQCVRAKDKGECACSKTAAAQGLTTSCFAEDPTGIIAGQCPGTRACSDKGLSVCTAQVPTKELCDGDDDNCDGQLDENSCDDGEPCTKDVCNGKNGCSSTPLTSPCNDGDACTDNDACANGKCVGAAVECDDANPCTDDSCDKVKGCLNLDNTALCDDGDKCTGADSCKGGVCAPGALETCDDKNACTTDKCNTGTGACDFAANVTPTTCDDGDACTDKDLCKDGQCVGGAVACDDNDPCTTDLCSKDKGCQHNSNTAFCDDGDACTVKDVCKAGTCAGAAVTCDDGEACTDDACDKDKGCTTTANSATCDDGDKCTKDDVCADGKCSGSKVSCDDGKICTDDLCDKGKGCVAKDNAAPCDDGDKCTEKDYCNKGACNGSAIKCDDGNSCTDDSCDKANGCAAKNNTATCDDGNKCSVSDVCAGGACKAGAAKTCDDKDACTTDSCEPVSGKCVFKAISNCKSCTSAAQCNDNNACTSESCKAGKCQGATLKDGATCDDGSYCTEGDACLAGSCKPGKTPTCEDNNPCTADLCDAAAKKCNNIPLAKGFKCGATKVRDDYKCVGAAVYKRAGFPGCSGSTTAPKCSSAPADLAYVDFVKIATCTLPKICRIEASGGFCGLPKQPDLLITGFKLDKTTYPAGSGVKVTWTVKNAGIVDSPKVKLAFYVSTDATIGGKGDIYKGAIDVAPIKPGQTTTGLYTVILRSNLGKATRYVGAIIDSLNVAKELNEKNNTAMQKITTLPAGDIWVSTSSRPQVTTLAWGQKTYYYRYTRNIGTVAVGKHTDRVWLSADMKVDKSDISLTSFAVPALKPNAYNYGWVSYVMPKTVKPGTWYVIFQADSGGQVAEGNEINNYRVTKITYKGYVDAEAVSVKALATIPTGVPFTVEVTGKNLGNATTGNFYDRVYLSKDAKLGGDVYLGYILRKAIAAGATYTSKLTYNLPKSVTGGTWYLLYYTDSYNYLKETNETNNLQALKVEIVPMPNVRTYYYKTYSATYYVNAQMSWYSYDRNYGTVTTKAYQLHYYISADDKLDAKDLLVAKYTRGPLKANQVQYTIGKWTIPGTYKPGKYWLFIKTDATNLVEESNEKDNLQKVAFTIKGRPDLTGTVKAPSGTILAGVKTNLTLTWKNIGLATAAKHYDRVYLNTKKSYGGSYLGQRTRDALAAGKSGSETFAFTSLSYLKTGTYYLNYRVDSSNQVAESDETNNISYQAIKITAVPDLYPYYLKVSTTKPNSGQTVAITWYVRNYGYGVSAKTTVRFVLSKDTKFSADDTKLGEADVKSLAYAKYVSGKTSVVVPKTMTGKWHLLMVVDPDDKVVERSEKNNTRYATLTVAAVPDIAVSSFVVSPTKAKTGTLVKVTAGHKNIGNKSTGFTAALYLIVSKTQSIKLMEKLQPTLGAGKSAATTESVVIPSSVKSGSYTLRWIVTVTGEVNKSNNFKDAAFTVL